jgi:flagellar protein FlaI
MDETEEKHIQQFLKNKINPDADDIRKFVNSLAEEHSSIDKAELTSTIKARSLLYNQQSSQLYKLEGTFSEMSGLDSPIVDEFKEVLHRAYEKHSEIEDVSNEIDTLNTILENVRNQSAKSDVSEENESAPDADKLHERIQKLKSENAREETKNNDGTEGDRIHILQATQHPDENVKPAQNSGDEEAETSELMNRISAGKSELSEMLEEKIETRGEVTAKEAAKGKSTSEKDLVKDLMEENLARNVESKIKSIKAKHAWVMEEKEPVTVIDRVKNYFAKETVEIEEYDPSIHGPLVTFDGLDKHEEMERYWVNEPYAFVVILNNIETNENQYTIIEPKLSRFEDIFLKEIKDRLRDVLLVDDIIPQEKKEMILVKKVKELVKDYAIDITPPLLEKILYYVIRDFVSFGPIDAIQKDDRIEDVSCNGHDVPVYLYHKQYANIATNVVFKQKELDSFIIRLAQRSGKHISVAEPLIDATMPDGSRIQMTLSTHVTAHGGTFTIRKFADVPLTPIDLINWGTFSAKTMAYLWLCIENNKSLIFAGGTASGKTSSLNAVALFIPRQAKVISLEDTRELKLPHPNWIPAITRDAFTADERGAVDMYELLRAALRQRPEFLLVGEVRGKEALTLFQAMSTGHTTFSTMHADSVSSAIHRLENPPISVPRTMIQALNIICIQSQTYSKGKRVRRNLKLVEITDIDPTTRNIRTNDIFSWDSMTDTFQRVGESKALNEIMLRRAWTIRDLKNELMYRQKILEFLARNNITDYHAVSTIIYEYSINPEKVLQKLKIIK